IREIDIVERELRTLAALGVLRLPSGRRTEILARLIAAAKLIVSRAFFRILERVVGFADFLELLLGVRFLRAAGMILMGELAVPLLDLVRRRCTLHTQYLVIVLVFHDLPALPLRGYPLFRL